MATRQERKAERKRRAFKAKEIAALPHVDEKDIPEEFKRRRSVVELCGTRYARIYAATKGVGLTQKQSAYLLCVLFMAHDGQKHLLDVDALSKSDNRTLAQDIFGTISHFDPKTGAVGNGFTPSCGFEGAKAG